MQGNRQINRGDIYYADLTPTIGSEQGGIRPVVIIQNDKGNLHSPTVIAAAVTGNAGKKLLPTHVRLGDSACGLLGIPLFCWSSSAPSTGDGYRNMWERWMRIG